MERVGRICVVVVLVSAATARATPTAMCVVGADGRAACGFDCQAGADGVAACARDGGRCERDGFGRVVCFGGRYGVAIDGDVPPAVCRGGNDGGAACGYACVVDALGRASCADTPNGACRVGADGRAACSRLGPLMFSELPATPAACVEGSDGAVVCGWGCRLGADGHPACAAAPGGACTVGGDGRVVCSAVDVVITGDLPRPDECLRGANGSVACGWRCLLGVDGFPACADTPIGNCRRDGASGVVCTRMLRPTRSAGQGPGWLYGPPGAGVHGTPPGYGR